MSEQNKKTIQERVLGVVKSGEVRMRPKWHFVLRTILFATGGILLVLVILYLISFIIFALRQTGVGFIPIFGFHGVLEFFRALPWLLIFLSLFFIVVLEILVRRYSFAYRRPLLYSALGIILITIIGGFLVAGTPLHRNLFLSAERRRLPLAGGLYHQFGAQQFRNIQRGTVTAVTSSSFMMQNQRSDVVNVVLTPQTRLPFGDGFEVGDTVVVFGDNNSSTITALGVRKVGE